MIPTDIAILHALAAGRPGWEPLAEALAKEVEEVRMQSGEEAAVAHARAPGSSRTWDRTAQRLRKAGLIEARPWRLTDAGRAALGSR